MHILKIITNLILLDVSLETILHRWSIYFFSICIYWWWKVCMAFRWFEENRRVKNEKKRRISVVKLYKVVGSILDQTAHVPLFLVLSTSNCAGRKEGKMENWVPNSRSARKSNGSTAHVLHYTSQELVKWGHQCYLPHIHQI